MSSISITTLDLCHQSLLYNSQIQRSLGVFRLADNFQTKRYLEQWHLRYLLVEGDNSPLDLYILKYIKLLQD